MKAVVRAWEANLNAGNNAAEARLFSLPALISQMEGPYGCYCLTAAEVAQWHTQLLCSAEIVSIKVRGRYATAVFRLGDRETSKCDSPLGSLTAVRFTIVRGKISAWQQMWWLPRGVPRGERPGAPITAAPPQPSRADHRMKAVVRAWNANASAGNNAAAARLFSLPARISLIEAPYGCRCRTPAEVAQWHTQLLCSAKIVSIEVRGRYATAVFRLGDRATSKCDAPQGSLTAVRFTIVRGKITAWKQMWFEPPGGEVIRAPGR